MRIINYIFAAILIIIPAISVSENVAVTSEAGTEVMMETTYDKGQGIKSEIREVFMKKGNRIRKDKFSVEGGNEKLVSVSIYDGESTWEISQEGREKTEGFKVYPWVFPEDKEINVKWGILNGEEVKIVEKDGCRQYVDPERDVVLFEEEEGLETHYRDYTLVEGVGLVPEVIEQINDRGEVVFKKELKRVEQFRLFPNDMFDPDKVEIDIISTMSHLPH